MTYRRAAIVTPLRTPVGKFLGSLASMTAGELGAVIIRALVDRSGIDTSRIDDVVFAQGYGDTVFADLANGSSSKSQNIVAPTSEKRINGFHAGQHKRTAKGINVFMVVPAFINHQPKQAGINKHLTQALPGRISIRHAGASTKYQDGFIFYHLTCGIVWSARESHRMNSQTMHPTYTVFNRC